MIELSKIEKELYLTLTGRAIDKDSRVGVMLELRQDEKNADINYAKMLKWLENNPSAGQEEIFDYIDKMGI